jgi:predicted Zn-dependent peptidase
MAVTVEDIKRVAAKYLRTDNSVVTLIKPEGKTP